MNKIPVRYDPVGFKRLFVPSFSMTIVALIILSISSYSLSLFGKLDLLSISVSMTAVIFIYAMVHWLTSHSWFSTREMRELNKVLIDLFKGLSWPQNGSMKLRRLFTSTSNNVLQPRDFGRRFQCAFCN